RLPDGGKERATDHPMYRLLRSRPNRRHTAAEFKALVQADLETNGNALARKIVVRRQVEQLVPIAWSRIADVPEASDGSLQFVVRDKSGSGTKTWNEDQVVHFTGPGGDGVVGASPVEEFKELFGLAYALEMYLAYTLRNAGRMSGFVSKKTGSLS